MTLRRSYDQYCGLAGALDLIGERWTLLVIRELMTGPKRYTDIATSLRGIGTSLLANRLKQLETDALITQTKLPPPAASVVYELTSVGDELAAALLPLIKWGLRHAVADAPGPTTQVKPDWALLPLIQANPEALEGIAATFEFVVSGSPAYLRIENGEASVLQAVREKPDATVRLDTATVAAIGSGRITATDAIMTGRIALEGDEKALGQLARAFDRSP